jgi:hypothetical protein
VLLLLAVSRTATRPCTGTLPVLLLLVLICIRTLRLALPLLLLPLVRRVDASDQIANGSGLSSS